MDAGTAGGTDAGWPSDRAPGDPVSGRLRPRRSRPTLRALGIFVAALVVAALIAWPSLTGTPQPSPTPASSMGAVSSQPEPASVPPIEAPTPRPIASGLYVESNVVDRPGVPAELYDKYRVEVDFHETTSICIERPIAVAEALEVISAPTRTNIAGKSSPSSTNPYAATVGLRLEPAPPDSGVEFRLDVDVKLVPLSIYKTVEAFEEHMGEYVREAFSQGLYGWQVTDCIVTMIDSGYRRTGSTAGDFRGATRLVMHQALKASGTQVSEPMADIRVELATAYASQVMRLLVQLGARVRPPQSYEGHTTIRGRIPVANVHELQAMLPGLTGGEGLVEIEPGGYEPVLGEPPTRRRVAAFRRASAP